MIEMESFEKGMGILAERFRAPLAPEAQKGYYAILSEELDTGEFRIAVKLAFRHAQFWPSPQQLINFVHPPRDFESDASIAWSKVLDAGEVTPGYGTNWRKDTIAEISDNALAAFIAIGANARLKSMTPESQEFVRRDFVREFKLAAKRSELELQIDQARDVLKLPRTRQASLPAGKPEPIGQTVERVMERTA